MEYMNRPNRSDIHLSKDEEDRIERETKEYFDGLAPKRHTKPQRSEYSSDYVDVNNNDAVIPEYVQFQRLEDDQEVRLHASNPFKFLPRWEALGIGKIVYKNGSQASEEFVETDYYKDLNGVDKQHHTTGKGFIKMETNNGQCYYITPDHDLSHHASSKGNPATNDWIPSADEQVFAVSNKPSRSDS